MPLLAVVGNEASWVAFLLLLAAVGALQTSRVGDVLRHLDAFCEDEARSTAHMRGSARQKPLQATSGTPSERLFGVRWLRRCPVSVTMLGLATLETS